MNEDNDKSVAPTRVKPRVGVFAVRSFRKRFDNRIGREWDQVAEETPPGQVIDIPVAELDVVHRLAWFPSGAEAGDLTEWGGRSRYDGAGIPNSSR